MWADYAHVAIVFVKRIDLTRSKLAAFGHSDAELFIQ